MSLRYFIHDKETVASMLGGLRATGEATGYNTEAFVDPSSGQRWEKYYIDDDEYGDDVFGLRRLPYPATDVLVDIAVTSQIADEVVGAVILLGDQEWNHRIEFREALLKAIELHWDQVDAERFGIISECTELCSPQNRREIVGKSDSEIAADFDYFKSLSDLAVELEQRVKAKTA